MGPMVALGAANTALNLLQSLSQPGSAVSAMLQAQWSATKLLSKQINDVHRTLAAVIGMIDNLEASFVDAIDTALIRTDIEGVRGLAQIFSEMVGAASYSPDFFTTAHGRGSLQEISSATQLLRGKISQSQYRGLPEAALALPTLLPLEISACLRLGYKRIELMPVIRSYEDWLTFMLSSAPSTLHDYQVRHLEKHDALVASAALSRLGRASKIFSHSSAKLDDPNANMPAATIGESQFNYHCAYFFGDFYGVGGKPVPIMLHMPGIGGGKYKTCSAVRPCNIISKEDEQLGIRLLEYVPDEWLFGFTAPGPITGAVPPNDAWAYVRTTKTPPQDERTAVDTVEAANFDPTLEVELKGMQATIESLNFHRACVGYAQTARSVAVLALEQLKTFCRQLGD